MQHTFGNPRRAALQSSYSLSANDSGDVPSRGSPVRALGSRFSVNNIYAQSKLGQPSKSDPELTRENSTAPTAPGLRTLSTQRRQEQMQQLQAMREVCSGRSFAKRSTLRRSMAPAPLQRGDVANVADFEASEEESSATLTTAQLQMLIGIDME